MSLFSAVGTHWSVAIIVACVIVGILFLLSLPYILFGLKNLLTFGSSYATFKKLTDPYKLKDNYPLPPVRIPGEDNLLCPFRPKDGGPCPKTLEHQKLCIANNHYPMCWKTMTKGEFFYQYMTQDVRTSVQALEATAKTIIKRWLNAIGILSALTPSHFYEKCATILLNSASVYSFSGLTADGRARFYFAHTVKVDISGKFWHLAGPLEVFVNLKKGVVDVAYIDGTKEQGGRKVEPDELLVVLALIWGANHIVVHNFSNDGADKDSCDPFIRKMSKVTLIFQYLGWTSLSNSAQQQDLIYRFQFGLPEMNNNKLVQLWAYSRYLRFVTPMNKKFENIFEKYQSRPEFKNITCQGLFFMTIMHSMDHFGSRMAVIKGDHFNITNKTWGNSALTAAFVMEGIGNNKSVEGKTGKMKDAKHPFYREVYGEMVKLDHEYADFVDMCIAR